MFIDTHCHISDKYYDDINQLVLENEKAGIEKIIISGCEETEITSSIQYINTYPNIYATIGYHPAEATKVTEEKIINLEKLVTSNKKIVGIGEIGLDYCAPKNEHPLPGVPVTRSPPDPTPGYSCPGRRRRPAQSRRSGRRGPCHSAARRSFHPASRPVRRRPHGQNSGGGQSDPRSAA